MKQWFKKFFIPSEENGYAPNSIEKRAAAVMLILVLATFSLANIQSIIIISSDWFVSSILPAVLVDLTNENRVDAALSQLTRSDMLDRAAMLKAQDMAKNEYFAHESPAGISPWYWFAEVGYAYAYAGENLAVHFTDSDAVVNAWMNSPGHRANIMKEQYTETGIGTAKGTYKGSSTIFVVQLFGTPLSAVPVQTVVAGAQPEPVAVASGSRVLAATTNTDAEPASTTDVERVPTQEEKNISLGARSTSTNDIPDTYSMAEDSAYEMMIDDGWYDTELESTLALAEKPEALFSDMATTSNMVLLDEPLAVASIAGFSQRNDVDGGWIMRLWRLFAAPYTVMTYVYFVLALYVFTTLVISIVIEWRHQHPIQLAYGVGLIAIMLLMLYVHLEVTSGALVV